MPRDSHDPATVEEVRRLVDGGPVDFLFIDGDHTYEGVKRDYEVFAPLVRSGGLIAIHDIAAVGAPGVVRFWTELRQTVETEQCVAPEEPLYGIGVIRAP